VFRGRDIQQLVHLIRGGELFQMAVLNRKFGVRYKLVSSSRVPLTRGGRDVGVIYVHLKS
jgi:hypothetical protein